MKKILFWAAVTILAAVSCNKIEEEGANTFEPSNVPSFVASVDGADTKTVIDGMKSYWNGKEEIWVLNGESNGEWKKKYVTEATKSEIATFNEEAAYELSGENFLAIYPADPATDVTWDGNIANAAKKFWLSDEQNATAYSYDPTAHIAVASTVKGNNNLEFKNVNSLVKVTVANDNVSEICFYGNSNEGIAGNFDVLYNNGDPKVNFTAGFEPKTSAKIIGKIENGSTYYISILPCIFEKGFSIEFVIDGVKYTKSLSSRYVVERKQIIDLPVVTFKPQVVETKTVYVCPNSAWISHNGRYAAYCWGNNTTATWYDMTDTDKDGIYEANLPTTFENVIFCCMNASSALNNWNNKLEQSKPPKKYIL